MAQRAGNFFLFRFVLSFFLQQKGDRSPLAQRAEEQKGEQKRNPTLHAPRVEGEESLLSSVLPPTQSPASSKRCAPHSATEPSGDGGKEFHTDSTASQIAILTAEGNGVDQRRSGLEWAYQE